MDTRRRCSALISVSLALSQTPAYTARPRIRGWCIARCECLSSSFSWYSLCMPALEGWPGWVTTNPEITPWTFDTHTPVKTHLLWTLLFPDYRIFLYANMQCCRAIKVIYGVVQLSYFRQNRASSDIRRFSKFAHCKLQHSAISKHASSMNLRPGDFLRKC